MSKNIHIPEGTSFRDYVRDSLDNALENGDDEFLASLEKRDAEAIACDMSDCDAGVERHLEIIGLNDISFAELVGIIEEWCEENKP